MTDFVRKNGKRRVVITGGGMLSALGDDVDEAFLRLKSYQNCIQYMPSWEVYTLVNTRLACPYTKPLPERPRKSVRGMGRVALLALEATERAIKMAHLTCANGSPSLLLQNGRTGIAYGSCMGSMDSIVDMYSMIEHNDTSLINSQTYIKCMPQTCLSNLSVFYGISGRMITTNTACTSGSQAVGYGYETIANGLQDIMLCGGAEELVAPDAAIFDTLGATAIQNTSPATEPRPFDKDRDGLVVGEGACTLVLEDMEHAQKRGAPIWAEVVGFGTNADGTHITNPNAKTMAKALELALLDAEIPAERIGYVNAHGTSTLAGDIAETEATFSVFKRAVSISSTKSYIGHTLGACGALEAWLSVQMMREGWFHPTINLHTVDPRCAPLDYIMGEGRRIQTDYVMSNNFAFGGINTSLIFKRAAEGVSV